MLKKFVFEDEVRETWRLSRSTMIRARRNGLPFVRLGRRLAYDAAALEKHFAKPREWRKTDVDAGERGTSNGSK